MVKDDFACNYPCTDINKDFISPKVKIDPEAIQIVMISEAPPKDHANYFYQGTSGTFFQTTKTAFQDAGIAINNYNDLTDLGLYLTTAIKCSKKSYLVSAKTIKECAIRFLKKEISQFPDIKVILCMGDFAIKAVNYIYQEKFKKSPIKSGSTYKIRKEKHILNGIRFIPSYTQTGESFNIEQSKRKMIAEDIGEALRYVKGN